MILAITGLEKYQHAPITIDQAITLRQAYNKALSKYEVKAYNSINEQIGILSSKCTFRPKVMQILENKEAIAKVWAIYKFLICVEVI